MERIALVTQNKKVIEAALNYVECELMNVVVKDVDSLNVGDQVYCLYQKKQFTAHIIKRVNYNLYLYLSLQESNFPTERRRFIRYHCSILDAALFHNQQQAASIHVVDISVNGFGFTTDKKLDEKLEYSIRLKTEDTKQITATIVTRNTVDHYRYGTEIRYIDEENLFHLRRFILQQQLLRQE
ncbi:PilZ domain-containing protein [Bacillus sp. HMF5848]|uniref:PilZ domain-containing protein n=1 Tax=Bacillus sp. HMF5848 TaxID=2495421 RepID=UPI000F7785CF|nr:PilZ domain-containing protein [Bacillus sp. HMF5848]RSK28305.1 PilZ domain-containing protein [Bacillus sp. HMF5848]